jgi:lysine decarboxylase
VKDGFAVEEALQAMGIYPEMADSGHVVFILTDADEEEDIARLRRGLDALGILAKKRPGSALPPPPPLPEQVRSPRRAFFGAQEERSFWEAEGAVAAEQLAPYPPDVPVVAPGERIQKKALSYLAQMGYNKQMIVCSREE